MVVLGLENLLKSPEIVKKNERLGLLYNQASVDSCFLPIVELIDLMFPQQLKTLFGPQHGVWGTEQDNMKETGHGVHPELEAPIYSLYAQDRKPDAKMLVGVDTVLIDLQDIGARVYTFATTALYMLQVCAQNTKKVIVLDRPNPISGDQIEGNILNPEYASFVGPYPIPMRHGMTLGELLMYYNKELSIDCNLTVIPITGWNRNHFFQETGLPWIWPSPNMPSPETALVYPGQVMLEGTNISEGRGTTKPFELFGAPFINQREVLDVIEKAALRGAILQPMSFKPTFHKWSDQVCSGFFIHVTDKNVFRPYRFSLALISALYKLYKENFAWTDPPYEYVTDKAPIDVILGDARVREDLQQGRSVLDMEKEWADDLVRFSKDRAKYLIY